VLLVTVLDVASAICRMSKARRPSDKKQHLPGPLPGPGRLAVDCRRIGRM